MEEKLSVPGNQKAQLAPVSETQYFSHIIKWPGENLTRISVWYTGTINNWQRIQEVNLSIDPRRIDIGDTILIPENLLITSEPMPMDFRGVVQERRSLHLNHCPEYLLVVDKANYLNLSILRLFKKRRNLHLNHCPEHLPVVDKANYLNLSMLRLFKKRRNLHLNHCREYLLVVDKTNYLNLSIHRLFNKRRNLHLNRCRNYL